MEPIIFYYFDELTDTSVFREVLERRFRETGHERRIEFRSWHCYSGLPEDKGDLYAYDGIVMSALAEKGLIRKLPEIIDLKNIFPWILETGRYRKGMYGVPFMTCTNVIISRKEDSPPPPNILDIHDAVSSPLMSMIVYYEMAAFCGIQDREGRTIDVLRHILSLMGGVGSYEKYDYDGSRRIKEFDMGECRYLLGITEDYRILSPGDYCVTAANFSDSQVNELPVFMTDFVSMSPDTQGEKLLDCLDIMEIITGSSFAYELCTAGGQLQYMLPADMTVYSMLAELDPIYNKFYEIASNPYNCTLRYSSRYYEEYPERKADLRKMITEDRSLRGAYGDQ